MKQYRYVLLMLFVLSLGVSWLSAQDTSPVIEPLNNTFSIAGRVAGMAISPDETKLAVADESLTFSLFDLTNQNTPIAQTAIGGGDVFLESGVHYNADGSLIAVGSFYATAVFDGETGTLLYTIAETTSDLAFSPDGTILYHLGHNTVTAYNSQSGEQLNSILVRDGDGGATNDLEVLADGTLVLLVSDSSYEYYVTTVTPDFSQIQTTSLFGRGLVAGGDVVVSVFYTRLSAYKDDFATLIAINLDAPCGDFTDVAFNPSGTLLAGVAGNCEIYVFDVDSGTLVYTALVSDAGKIAFGTNSLYVSSASNITRYAVNNLTETTTSPIVTTETEQTSTEETSITPTTDRPLVIYDLLFLGYAGRDIGFSGVAVSPDGRKVAGISGFGNQIVVYREDLMELARSERGAGTNSIAFSADSTRLVAVDASSLVMIFDADTMQLLAQAQLSDPSTGNMIANDVAAYVFGADFMNNAVLHKIDLATGTLTTSTSFEVLEFPTYLGFLENGNLVGTATNMEGTIIKIWDADLNEVSSEVVSYWGIEAFDDILLYTGIVRDGDAMRYRYTVQNPVGSDSVAVGDDDCILVEFAKASDNAFAVGIRFRCALVLFNLDAGTVDVRLEGDSIGGDVALSPDNTVLYVATPDGIAVYGIITRPR